MNDKIYHNLIQRISLILDGRGFSSEEYSFRKQLSYGKYSSWAKSITAEQLIPILCAIGLYGRNSPDTKDIPIKQQRRIVGKLNKYREKCLLLKFNEPQTIALLFLNNKVLHFGQIYFPIDDSYFSWKHPQFKDNIRWVNFLRTPSDFLGIIWLVKNLVVRYHPEEDCLTTLAKDKQIYYEFSGGTTQGRFLEALICLTRVSQYKQTYYRCGLCSNGIGLLPESILKKTVYIFLDIDGVLVKEDKQGEEIDLDEDLLKLDKNCAKIFENVVRQHKHVKIVISSSWREIFNLDTIKSVFSENIADKIEGVTPIYTKPTKFFRHSEVIEYLSKNDSSSESWIAIDDIAEHYPDNISIVVTNPYVGFDEKAAMELDKFLTMS